MVTRLRKYSRHRITKAIAFLLFVIFVTAAVLQLQYILIQGMDTESLYVKEYTNSKDFISYISQPVYEVMDNYDKREFTFDFHYYDGENIYHQEIARNSNPEDYYNIYYSDILDGWVYVSVPANHIEERAKDWNENREQLLDILHMIVYFTVISILLLIYLVNVTGREQNHEELRLNQLDYIYFELKLIGFCLSTGLLIYIIYVLSNSVSPFVDFDKESPTAVFTDYFSNHIGRMIDISIITALITSCSMAMLLSLVRTMKIHGILSNSLIYKLIIRGKRIWNGLIKILAESKLYRGYSPIQVLYYRQQLFFIGCVILTLLIFIFIIYGSLISVIFILLGVIFTYWYFKGNQLLYRDITKGYNDSIAEQMKSERTKVALITNVSHDLKTPLTSIISYLDLLSREEGMSNAANDYVKILQDKSNRLKNIINDLFELAKSTSGDITLSIEKLDLKKLIEQTMADMEDRIEASGIQIKCILPDESVNIEADGKKLYRIFQNVIDNALKYSLKGTRVFLELSMKGEKAITSIKNTAGYEIDFTPEEILQRFTRGDNSRTTEGSGLGLSIAESFTKVSGGDFKVEIDGDMFKVYITFDLSTASEVIDGKEELSVDG